ncbi:Chromosome transmission fidelity protein 18 [Cladophialophora chaetospira]|uniref:Chromosome transmission fidelity protein 18 n=1 Tax=Cladophialophora chaetospira TaxID=386627 RepID=A0AA39CEU2_9EURO|nr:Chromosome transmission fidelity protein 18 [Cladophialophora chaetospira]
MTFSSSPVLYPVSSSPVPAVPSKKKRRLFQPFPTELQAKKPKTVGGFLVDSDDEEDGVDKTRELQHPQSSLEKEPALPTPPNEHTETATSKTHAEATRTAEIPSSPTLPPLPRPLLRRKQHYIITIETSAGTALEIPLREKSQALSYEQIIAQRSVTAAGRAKKAYYGIEIHKLMDDAKTQLQLDGFEKQRKVQQQATTPPPEVPTKVGTKSSKSIVHQMWTEKYRAKKFTELVGDERTHRQVLRWLKAWDDIVFPGSTKPMSVKVYDDMDQGQPQHRKILLLTGPPGLGKTTLAHVCAKQAGYEVLEINASDERSRDVVKGRIKDALGTETVRGIKEHGKARKAGRPVCVVVDEVDGVTTGSGSSGGEGGFVKALIDLVQLDQKNATKTSTGDASKGKKKGDKFRMLRPLILVCNDVYAPSLRPLRTSSMAEIVHVRKAPIDKVIARVKNVFEKEHIACDNDAVRRLCENAWGLAMRKQRTVGTRGSGEGDIRGVLVQAEWIAHKLRANAAKPRLTRQWLEPQLQNSETGQKGLGRGGTREVVERVFLEGAGLPNLPTNLSADEARLVSGSKSNPVGVANLRKRAALTALREMMDTCGDHDRVMTDCFATYPTQTFQDDVQLSKPNASYDWLHFHDCLSSRIYSGQEWELTPYLSTSACGFHHLFAAVDKGNKAWNEEVHEEEQADVHPFSGLKADFAAYEAEKQTKTLLSELQSNFSGSLLRLFSSVDAIATELIPNVGKMLAPDVKPVVIGGSGGSASVASVRKETEKTCVRNAVRTMLALDLSFEQVRVEFEGGGAHSNGGYVYRMEPPLDNLLSYHMDKSSSGAGPIRYTVRQVLDQELKKEKILQSSVLRQARSGSSYSHHDLDEHKENENPAATVKELGVKRDFFGRVITEDRPPSAGKAAKEQAAKVQGKGGGRIWVSFHEGFSNAVRKPITLKELMDGF